MIFLGIHEKTQVAFWTTNLTSNPFSNSNSNSKQIANQITNENENQFEFVDTRPFIFSLDPLEASLIGYARSLVDWNARYTFCPNCGSEQETVEWGHKKKCKSVSCSSHNTIQNYSYPRTDAVVITLVISLGYL